MAESAQLVKDSQFVIAVIPVTTVRSASDLSVPMAIVSMEDVVLFKVVVLTVIAQEQTIVGTAVRSQFASQISVLMGAIVTFTKEVHTAIVPRISEEIDVNLQFVLLTIAVIMAGVTCQVRRLCVIVRGRVTLVTDALTQFVPMDIAKMAVSATFFQSINHFVIVLKHLILEISAKILFVSQITVLDEEHAELNIGFLTANVN